MQLAYNSIDFANRNKLKYKIIKYYMEEWVIESGNDPAMDNINKKVPKRRAISFSYFLN